VLLVGRLLGGIATSLLFSAFEAWAVAAHNSSGFPESLLGDLFTKVSACVDCGGDCIGGKAMQLAVRRMPSTARWICCLVLSCCVMFPPDQGCWQRPCTDSLSVQQFNHAPLCCCLSNGYIGESKHTAWPHDSTAGNPWRCLITVLLFIVLAGCVLRQWCDGHG
jgi:hypothetical protein